MYQYSGERINTGIQQIDEVERTSSLDIQNYQLLLENGNNFTYEYTSNSYVILESFNPDEVDVFDQSDDFEALKNDVLDFSETNPFGEY